MTSFWTAARVLLALHACLGSAAWALGGDPVAIGTILTNPEPFHMKHVLLRGRIKEVQELEPYYLASGAGCYGAYRLTLQDETGSLLVAVLGVCGTPFIRPAPAVVDERVTIKAQIHAPGHLGTFYGLDRRPIPGSNPDELHAVAAEIIHEPR